MMLLDFLRARPRQVAVVAVVGLFVTLISTSLLGLVSIGDAQSGATLVVLFVVMITLVVAGAILFGVVIHTLGNYAGSTSRSAGGRRS